MTRQRASARAAAAALVAVLAFGAATAPARASEGPGYGGTARDLSVTWTSASSVTKAAGASVLLRAGHGGAAAPVALQTAPGTLALSVQGLGFRAKSLVTVRVGAGTPVVARADTAGALSIEVPPSLTGQTLPGVSVVADGRNPAGTAVTMVGSVPPLPSGSGPNDWVLWIVATVFVLWGARATLGRVRRQSAGVA